MKKSIIILMCLLIALSFGAFAKETVAEHSGWMSVDFCYYPGVSRSNVLYNGGSFATIDTGNWGIEGRITPWYQAKVATPMGEHWLVSDSNLKFMQGLEVTPVSVMPKTQLTWEILPFLLFNTGVNVGTGWDVGTTFVGGMAAYDGKYPQTAQKTDANGNTYYQAFLNYTPLKPFENMYFEPWAELGVQMDFSAFAPQEIKDWMHIVFTAAYKVKYTTLTGTEDGQIWKWQLSGDKFTGWQQDVNVLIGYQMPKLPLNTVGLQFEFEQYFDRDIFHNNGYYDYSAFATCPIFSLAPVMLFKINDHHSIALQGRFKTTRILSDDNKSATGTLVGTAWYFDRIAISYTWNF